MMHTSRLRWRLGLVYWFINRFLRKFERARNRCEDSVVIVDEKIAELKTLRTQFSDKAAFVNNFLSSLKG